MVAVGDGGWVGAAVHVGGGGWVGRGVAVAVGAGLRALSGLITTGSPRPTPMGRLGAACLYEVRPRPFLFCDLSEAGGRHAQRQCL
jgi:hypothetical protein